MRLLHLLQAEAGEDRLRILLMAAISGAANVALLAVINSGAQSVTEQGVSTRYFILFVLSLLLFVVTQRYIFDRGTELFEELVERMRVRLVRKVHRTDLASLERLGSSEIYAKLTSQTAIVAQSAGPIVAAVQSIVMVTLAWVYIAILSKTAFVLSILMVSGGVGIYLLRQQQVNAWMHEAAVRETELFRLVTHSIDGFKEVKMSSRRGEELLARLEEVAASLRETNVRTGAQYNGNYIFSQIFFYSLIGANVFILPKLMPTFESVVVQLTTAILFLIGPLSNAVGGIPVYGKAEMAAVEIAELEAQLDRNQVVTESGPVSPDLFLGPGRATPEIELRAVEFSYLDRAERPAFSIGPIDLVLEPGELVFVVGGNGSGKSTLAKVLTGLYLPSRGRILCNGEPVHSGNVQAYRELFSVVYGDFHLFDRLYGLDPEPSEVQRLLKRFQLDGKTSFVDGRFTDLDLSTGQRKRLGLVVALLENRPVLLFDEWAADQDVEFRRFFYEDILPRLKAEGRTVVAISHDDRYYGVADRVVRLDMGRVRGLVEAT